MAIATDQFDMRAAPMRIGTVGLKVRDLGAVSAFYLSVLGLKAMAIGDNRVTLGTGMLPLLELVGDHAFAPHDPGQAGLFHTAFLMPSRADLARWLAHAAGAGVPLQGASDHIVSEAIYLADPEGNGIEIYADRPVSRWSGPNGEIRISSDPLDAQALLKEAQGTSWSGFPEGGIIGHVHLQVGDIEAADGFYRNVLGFDVTARYPGASFYGSGGYHHQLAGNVWKSRRTGTRSTRMGGLGVVEIVVRDAATLAAIAARAESAGIEIVSEIGGMTLRDPWGNVITLRN